MYILYPASRQDTVTCSFQGREHTAKEQSHRTGHGEEKLEQAFDCIYSLGNHSFWHPSLS